MMERNEKVDLIIKVFELEDSNSEKISEWLSKYSFHNLFTMLNEFRINNICPECDMLTFGTRCSHSETM